MHTNIKYFILCASSHGCAVADDVWRRVDLAQVFEQQQRLLPLPTLLARRDARAVTDDVRRRVPLAQVFEQQQRLLPLPALLARRDARVVADDVGATSLLRNAPSTSNFRSNIKDKSCDHPRHIAHTGSVQSG